MEVHPRGQTMNKKFRYREKLNAFKEKLNTFFQDMLKYPKYIKEEGQRSIMCIQVLKDEENANIGENAGPPRCALLVHCIVAAKIGPGILRTFTPRCKVSSTPCCAISSHHGVTPDQELGKLCLFTMCYGLFTTPRCTRLISQWLDFQVFFLFWVIVLIS